MEKETLKEFMARTANGMQKFENPKLVESFQNKDSIYAYSVLLQNYGVDNMGSLLELFDEGVDKTPLLSFISAHNMKWFLEHNGSFWGLQPYTEEQYTAMLEKQPLTNGAA